MNQDFSFRHFIHQKIIEKHKEVQNWFAEKTKNRIKPFYSSFDIRDSNLKIACVDANVFPAGFNNICEEDQKRAGSLIRDYLKKNHPKVRRILLLSEEHTRNLYYWDNVFVIKSLIEQAGFEVVVCAPGKLLPVPQTILTAGGRELKVHLFNEEEGDLTISNNDFSVQYDLPPGRLYNPPLRMGWQVRKKHHFFKEYNLLACEFANLLQINPHHLTVETELFSPFDMDSKDNLSKLKSRAGLMLQSLQNKPLSEMANKDKPYLFLKNNSGTYGLGIIHISSPEDIDRFNAKARKKMRAVKGDTGLSEIIIQEGIPTALHSADNQSAEPAVYMIGSQVAGGFLRSHRKKDHKTNLNSPGAVFRRFCMSDLEIKIQGLVMENVYGWLAKLGVLALCAEMENKERG